MSLLLTFPIRVATHKLDSLRESVREFQTMTRNLNRLADESVEFPDVIDFLAELSR